MVIGQLAPWVPSGQSCWDVRILLSDYWFRQGEKHSSIISVWAEGVHWLQSTVTGVRSPAWKTGSTTYCPSDLEHPLPPFCSSVSSSVVWVQFNSVAQLCPTLRLHELQHARPPCPSPTPGAYSNSCPLSWWCHPAISSSVVPFSSCLQSFPASGSFQMSRFFAAGGQSIGASASTSVLPMNIQDWSPLGLTGWISLQSKILSRVLSNTTVQNQQFFGAQLSLWSNSHIHTWLLEKP